jgi:uncharacterized integral membrane protein
MQVFLYFGLFISILAILFAVQNNDPVTVSFIIWQFSGSLALVLLITMAAGALISSLISVPNNVKARLTSRNLRKKIDQLENTIKELHVNIEEQKSELQDSFETIKQLQLQPIKKEASTSSAEIEISDDSNSEPN